MKLEANGVRTVLMHALMHTQGVIARPWQKGLQLGAVRTSDGLVVVMKSDKPWSGKLHFDIPRHREYLGFTQDWPRINTLPEWFTVERHGNTASTNRHPGSHTIHLRQTAQRGIGLDLAAGEDKQVVVRKLEQ
jgi:hypothetical protein